MSLGWQPLLSKGQLPLSVIFVIWSRFEGWAKDLVVRTRVDDPFGHVFDGLSFVSSSGVFEFVRALLLFAL
jgi:hypothetical protein